MSDLHQRWIRLPARIRQSDIFCDKPGNRSEVKFESATNCQFMTDPGGCESLELLFVNTEIRVSQIRE
jgi:hypothetical protein